MLQHWVTHPSLWKHGGFHEIQNPQKCYRIIDQEALLGLTEVTTFADYQILHQKWVNKAISERQFLTRHPDFSETFAVGSEAFITRFKSAMDIEHHQRKISKTDDGYFVKESSSY